jgi:hypothetical protein
MRPPEEVKRELVRSWVAKAEEDRAVTQKLPYDDPQCVPSIAEKGCRCQVPETRNLKPGT